MRIHELLLGIFLFVLPSYLLAGWQIAKSNEKHAHDSYYKDQDAHQNKAIIPSKALHRAKPHHPIYPLQKTEGEKSKQISSVKSETVKSETIAPPAMPIAAERKEQMLTQSSSHSNSQSHFAGSTYYRRVIAAAKLHKTIETYYTANINGSLKENVERIMRRYHWKVIWKAPYDFNYDGRVSANSLPNLVEKLFQPFPLQAVMYMSNHTLAIVPRVKT